MLLYNHQRCGGGIGRRRGKSGADCIDVQVSERTRSQDHNGAIM